MNKIKNYNKTVLKRLNTLMIMIMNIGMLENCKML